MAEPPRTIPLDHAREHPEGHEHTDVNVRILVIAAAAVIVAAVVIHTGLYFLYISLSRQEAADPINRPRTAIGAYEAAPPADVPRVQGIPGYHTSTPREDMAVLRARNEEILGGYGPGDASGFVRIPIDRAMDLALERGMFPVREASSGEEGGDDARP